MKEPVGGIRKDGNSSPHVRAEQQAQELGAVAAAQVLFGKSHPDSADEECQFWRKVRVL